MVTLFEQYDGPGQAFISPQVSNIWLKVLESMLYWVTRVRQRVRVMHSLNWQKYHWCNTCHPYRILSSSGDIDCLDDKFSFLGDFNLFLKSVDDIVISASGWDVLWSLTFDLGTGGIGEALSSLSLPSSSTLLRNFSIAN